MSRQEQWARYRRELARLVRDRPDDVWDYLSETTRDEVANRRPFEYNIDDEEEPAERVRERLAQAERLLLEAFARLRQMQVPSGSSDPLLVEIARLVMPPTDAELWLRQNMRPAEPADAVADIDALGEQR